MYVIGNYRLHETQRKLPKFILAEQEALLIRKIMEVFKNGSFLAANNSIKCFRIWGSQADCGLLPAPCYSSNDISVLMD